MIHDREFLKLMNLVMDTGHIKGDRTGTGTTSLFSPPNSYYDLSDNSIPLLTVKEMKLNSIIRELLWYIAGDSNINYLKQHKVNIWNEWADPTTGDLGPVYGYLWRSFTPPGTPLLYDNKKVNYDINAMETIEKTCVRELVTQDEVWLYEIWKQIPKHHLHSNWRCFEVFSEEVKSLPNWHEATRHRQSYTLYKDFFGNCNVFCKSNAAWVQNDHYDIYTNEYSPVVAMTPFGNKFFFDSFHARLFLCDAYSKTKIKDINQDEHVVRFPPHVDQLQDVINTIKTNPQSRRMIISSWHPSFLPDESADPSYNARMGRQALPPCHYEMQWNVNPENTLNLKLTMRSNDLFLGAPFNIAQYSILLHMVAHVTGLKPGVFIHSVGDAHVYSNHIEQCNTIRLREPFESPTIEFARIVDNINDFKFDDIIINNYHHHSFVKAPVAK